MTNIYLPKVKMDFPNLAPIADDQWSESSYDYNCIAWAAEDEGNWWWPVGGTPFKPSYWPKGAPRVATIPAFIQAFATLGYAVCDDRKYEVGFTKIGLYATLDEPRKPTHMARQLPSGIWTSKLGDGPDIFHATLECLEGTVYGTIAAILRKPNK